MSTTESTIADATGTTEELTKDFQAVTTSKPSRIRLSAYRGAVLEGLHDLQRLQRKMQATQQELEQTVASAAKMLEVDLTKFVLDVESLEFIERPTANPVTTPTV